MLKRTEKITVYLTKTEKDAIENKSIKFGIAMSSYIRSIIMSHDLQTIPTKSQIQYSQLKKPKPITKSNDYRNSYKQVISELKLVLQEKRKYIDSCENMVI